MKGFKLNIGSTSSRRRIATLVAIIGIAFVGSRLAAVWPREVRVAFDVGPEVEELAVDYLQDGQAVMSVRLRRPEGKAEVFKHTVRLQPGAYQVQISRYGQETLGIEEVRALSVPASGVTRFNLKDATDGS